MIGVYYKYILFFKLLASSDLFPSKSYTFFENYG